MSTLYVNVLQVGKQSHEFWFLSKVSMAFLKQASSTDPHILVELSLTMKNCTQPQASRVNAVKHSNSQLIWLYVLKNFKRFSSWRRQFRLKISEIRTNGNRFLYLTLSDHSPPMSRRS
jgi:hypothetical protein